jgi:Ni/Co efflux regulator RcnB
MLLFASLVALPSAGALADNMPPPGHHDQGHQDQMPGHDQHQGKPDHHTQNRPPAEHPEFNADQSGFARDYYRNHKWEGKPLPHGERIVVGHRLPKGAYKRPLPAEFQHRFQSRPGYQSYVVGDDIVLVAIATGIVVDVLANVH